jgi:hypothetical protein
MEESRGGARASARWRKWNRILHGRMCGRIRPRPTWGGGVNRHHRCRRPLYREHGHRFMTGSVVGGAGPVTRAPG